jgi:hypothetical protein
MSQSSSKSAPARWPDLRRALAASIALLVAYLILPDLRLAVAQEDVQDKVRQLTESMKRVQAQLDESQRQLAEMRRQLAELAGGNAAGADPAPQADGGADAAKLAAEVEDLRERQAVTETQVGVEEQTKVESESKFPVKLSGLLLMNGFVNIGNVDMPSTPTLALPGAGSTGFSARQTILGLDMGGPHLFGARSHADVRVDFDGGTPSSTGYTGGYGGALVRLRTAHAALSWDRTEAFFALDRPLTSARTPDSLTAVAEPPLAWTGNLWSWSPQFGVREDLGRGRFPGLRLEAGTIDLGDAPYTASVIAQNGIVVTDSTAEASRWPGAEARIAYPGRAEGGFEIGAGGIFAPHRSIGGTRFDSWAGTLDARIPVTAHMLLTGAFYRGQGLGSLGGGAYKDYVYRLYDGQFYFRTLDDVGGWGQWKQKLSERLEFNEAVGIDNVPAGQLRPYAGVTTSVYQDIARNRAVTGNVIYSPSAYLVFSLEYRRIATSAVNGITVQSDMIGLGAGYKF